MVVLEVDGRDAIRVCSVLKSPVVSTQGPVQRECSSTSVLFEQSGGRGKNWVDRLICDRPVKAFVIGWLQERKAIPRDAKAMWSQGRANCSGAGCS